MDKPIRHLYGEFSPKQMAEYKSSLHSSIFWLLLYKDPKTSHQWKHVDVDKYINALLRRVAGLNTLLGEPTAIVTLLSVLQAIRDENLCEDYDWQTYRKLVLDAQALVDLLPDKGN